MAFAPETFFQIGRFPVTNTVINTILVDGFLILLALAVRSKIALIPGKFQHLMEIIIGGAYSFVEGIAGKKTENIFPYFITFMIFILVANWSGLIPGITTFGVEKFEVKDGHETMHIIPFIRPLTSDLNATFALALISLGATHLMAIRALGLQEYLSKFFAFVPFLVSLAKGKPKFNVDVKNPLNLVISVITPLVMTFVGLLELVSEFVKAISLSFRLFGNIYAGEVVLETVHGIFAFAFPLPFLLLEVIVGVVQALVFAMLTMAFMVILSTSHHEEETHKEVSH
jgi:F-type H+-transporting ATPase subunit a